MQTVGISGWIKALISALGCDGHQVEAAERDCEVPQTDAYGLGSSSTVQEEAGRETSFENTKSLSGWICSLT